MISVSTTAITVLLSLFAAYSLTRIPFKGRNLIQLCSIAVKLRLNNTISGLVLFQIAMNLPLGIWFTKAFIKGIPESLEESAKLDGCSRIQVIWKIILPLAVPGLVVVGFNTFLASWNDYLLPSILIDLERIKPLMLGLYIYFNQNIGIVWGK